MKYTPQKWIPTMATHWVGPLLADERKSRSGHPRCGGCVLGTLWRLGLCEGSHAPGSWLLVLTQPSLPWALPQAQLPRQSCFSVWDPMASPTITAGTCRWPLGFSGDPGLALSPSSTDTFSLRPVGQSLGQKEVAEPWLVGITCSCRRSPHVVQCLQP